MRSYLALLVLGLAFDYAYSQQSIEPECRCNLNNLWLDVYVVIDDSTKMGTSGLSQVASSVFSTLANSRVGSDYSDKRGARVAVITYNENAYIRSNLSDLTSNQDLENVISSLQVSKSDISNIQTPLKLINEMMGYKDGNGPKNNTMSVIIMYAADYIDYDQPTANQLAYYLKENGVTIITVANMDDSNKIMKLKALASEGYGFSLSDENLTAGIQKGLCDANCFCPEGYHQFMYPENNTTRKFGSCIEAMFVERHWSEARLTCQNRNQQGYLATEFSIEKALFNQALFDGQLRNYHIGLHFVNGAYFWEQKNGMPLLPLTKPLYQLDKFPGSNSLCVGNTVADSKKFESWKNENCYTDMKGAMCETVACDTENYCSNPFNR
ncbi:Protein CBR-CLEC-218 [Caenorhabditis briggsae]|uniref:Protein CBR-CLEC-218 n=1 Tax=Caenorhabditis briggsae TaxID=6238 RepID=A8WQ36_CAEBR|nr:Protein CBR-CLEC-218 [Caenorhabditis briggsae]CAP22594.1 Protein CBR-CLEC-218 [Caenorhabditis briggsae]